jgi:two-component system phosphate regulon sensor histidine kinase PhoR
MVEKLLETATLDGDSLTLVKESVNIVNILRTLVEKHQMQTEHKTIDFLNSFDTIMASIDVFHFENAINNILDNAIKYGGNEIKVTIEQNSNYFTISISDNGNSITKANKDKIFEKFYRIPKGNTHDVKGFGIGLYYTKKIVEKHGGSIHLKLEKNITTFKLSFPNA